MNTRTLFSANFFLFFSLFLLTFFNTNIIKLINGDFDKLIGPWKLTQYFFSYSSEFTKRALIGTFYELTSIDVSFSSILILSVLSLILFFIIIYTLARSSFILSDKKYFNLFIILFIISPATVMHFGIDLGRFDHITFAIMALMVLILTHYTNSYLVIFIPLLISINLLIHEAFLFTGLSLILTISYNEYKQQKVSKKFLLFELVAIVISLVAILFYGQASPSTLNYVLSEANNTYPDYKRYDDAVSVLSRSISDNLNITLPRYLKIDTWVHILFVLPLLTSYMYLMINILTKNTMSKPQWLVLLSPLTILPLFLLGADFFRWFALFLTLEFIIFIYLIQDLKITFNNHTLTILDKTSLGIIILYTFLGPLGIMATSFPYFFAILQRLDF